MKPIESLLGANWRTSVTGWITVAASAIAIKPELVAFLPDPPRGWITGAAGLIAILSGGTFAAQAKDRQVTGGTVPNDDPVLGVGNSARRIVPLIALALLPVSALTGCAWVQAHRTQIDGSLAVVGQRALDVAESVLISAAVNQVDKQFKADFLDSVASGLRQNEATIVNAEDVAKIVRIWSPNDGAQWQQLAGNLGTVAGHALETAGQTNAATVVENIATGLNTAAAKARAEGANN